MRIGLFIDTFFPMVDGVIVVVDNYARELAKTDDVTVFCPYTDKKVLDDLPYKVVQCPYVSLPFFDYGIPLPLIGAKFQSALKKSELDIVHIHSPFFIGKAGLKYAKKHNIPAVATIHSQYDKDVKKAVGNSKILFDSTLKSIIKVYERVDKCFTVNEKMKEHFTRDLGLKNDCKVLKNASSLSPVADMTAACALVDETFSIKKGQNVYVYVGRLDLIKNLEFLIEALACLKEKGSDFKMLFVGDGHDRHKLTALVSKSNLDGDVVFTGRIRDKDLLAAIYARARLLLFPSLYDANSLVQIEAASQSTPTLFIKGAITASTTKDGVNAFHADNSVQAFADKIIETEKDKELYERVSKGAKRDLYIDWETAVKEVRKEYTKLIESAKIGR